MEERTVLLRLTVHTQDKSHLVESYVWQTEDAQQEQRGQRVRPSVAAEMTYNSRKHRQGEGQGKGVRTAVGSMAGLVARRDGQHSAMYSAIRAIARQFTFARRKRLG
jgi:hypothetical protein